MKKEVLIAIIIGFSVGLIITYGVHTAQSSILAQKENSEAALSPSSNATLTDPAGDGTHSLIIYSPQTEDILATSTIQISGITSPDSMIAAISGEDSSSIVADSQGSFVLEFELETGGNIVELTSYALTGEVATEILELVQSKVNLSRSSSASSSAEGTS